MAKVVNGKKQKSLLARFIGNKNTVTFLGIIACVAVLIIGYNYRVNIKIAPKTVPYAKVNIPARSLITSDMIGRIKISGDYATNASNLVINVNEVVNKYASYKTSIPQGSLFYDELLMSADEMPDAAFANIADGYTIYSLSVTNESTYDNSIRAGDYIDLYVSTTDEDTKKIIFAKLIESIRVLAVKDSQGNNILSYKSGSTPSEILFAVEDDMYELLMASQFVSPSYTITPVIRNSNYTLQENETQISSKDIESRIRNKLAQ